MTDQQWEDFLQMLERVGKLFVQGNSVILFTKGPYYNMGTLADVVDEIMRTHGHDLTPGMIIRSVILWEDDLEWDRTRM